MRSLTFVVTVVMMTLGTANAQETGPSHRLTADVFVAASFPAEIIEAAQKADEIAQQTQEKRAPAKEYLEHIEPVFDRAVFMPQIPLEIFEELQNNYEAALQRYWDTDRETRQADDRVEALYYNWTLAGSDTKSAQVFQEWKMASRIDYIEVSKDEEEAYRLMINIGRARIYTGHQNRNSWRRPAPSTMWRINDKR